MDSDNLPSSHPIEILPTLLDQLPAWIQTHVTHNLCHSRLIEESMQLATHLAVDLLDNEVNELEENVTEWQLNALKQLNRCQKHGSELESLIGHVDRLKKEQSHNVDPPSKAVKENRIALTGNQFEYDKVSPLTKSELMKSEQYLSYLVESWDAKNPGKSMPGLDALLPQDLEAGEDEETLLSLPSLAQVKCPLTQNYLEDPVVHTPCGHVFSNKAILQYLQTQRDSGRAPHCPVRGCTAQQIHQSRLIRQNPIAEASLRAVKRLKVQKIWQSLVQKNDYTVVA